MNSITVKCPGCQYEFTVDKNVLGEKAECGNCKMIFILKETEHSIPENSSEFQKDDTPGSSNSVNSDRMSGVCLNEK